MKQATILLCAILLLYAGQMVIHKADGTVQRISVSGVDSITFEENSSQYPIHENIKVSTFWAGEGASSDNGNISNLPSAWDSDWATHFGIEDHPTKANRDSDFIPTDYGFKNASTKETRQNPYYFALPYNDYGDLDHEDKNGNQVKGVPIDSDWRKVNSYEVVYWADEKSSWDSKESMCKNRWIKITLTTTGKVCYAQWADCGPYYYNDHEYVFGTADQKNQISPGAGIDLSPSVGLYLGKEMEDWGAYTYTVNWQFVHADDVPDGPWKKVITTNQTNW